MRRLAYSEHSTNFVEVGYNEANDVCLLDFNVGYHQTPLDLSVETPHGLMDMGGLYLWTRAAMGTQYGWPLLSAQHVEHNPSGTGVSNLRALH